MRPIDTSLIHHVIVPENPSSGVHPALILLHGRGADEEDLLGLSESLDDRLLILSVRAPYPFAYGGGYTWYDADSIGTPDPEMFEVSYDKLATFINDALAAYPIDRSRLFLFGFSMGGVMSYAVSLSRPELVRGVIAHSGYIPEGTHLTLQWSNLRSTGFFIAHGVHDPVIPVSFARRARELFDQAEATFMYREYPMGHQISDESLSDASGWLSECLTKVKGA